MHISQVYGFAPSYLFSFSSHIFFFNLKAEADLLILGSEGLELDPANTLAENGLQINEP